MISDEDDGRGWILGVVFGVVALVIALAIGVSMHFKNVKNAGAAASANATATSGAAGAAGASAVALGPLPIDSSAAVAAQAAAAATADTASVKVENGVVKFYFASGKADVAAGGTEALSEIIKAITGGKKAVLSGYHDATGDPAQNAELAKQRALAVRDALLSLGIGEDKVELKKPEVSTASGSNAEARRVEVTLQ